MRILSRTVTNSIVISKHWIRSDGKFHCETGPAIEWSRIAGIEKGRYSWQYFLDGNSYFEGQWRAELSTRGLT